MTKTITVHVPVRFAIRGGRKTIISEIEQPQAQPRTENALLKALAKAHRWRWQIENGEHASITELAKAQRVNASYACRLLRLTLLAPEIVVEILNGAPDDAVSMSRLMKPFPIEWAAQLSIFRPSRLTNK